MGLPVLTTMPGTISFTAPNVCKLPPFGVPAPLPSLGISATTLPTSQAVKVFTVGCPTSVLGSSSPMTLPADAAGLMLGMTGMIMGAQVCTMGATRIFKAGRPTATLTSAHTMNASNTVGLNVSPSQPKIFCAP